MQSPSINFISLNQPNPCHPCSHQNKICEANKISPHPWLNLIGTLMTLIELICTDEFNRNLQLFSIVKKSVHISQIRVIRIPITSNKISTPYKNLHSKLNPFKSA